LFNQKTKRALVTAFH